MKLLYQSPSSATSTFCIHACTCAEECVQTGGSEGIGIRLEAVMTIALPLTCIMNNYITFLTCCGRYFHVNFGFNTYLFDWLHGTLRRPDRQYGEDIFGGKGRKKD